MPCFLWPECHKSSQWAESCIPRNHLHKFRKIWRQMLDNSYHLTSLELLSQSHGIILFYKNTTMGASLVAQWLRVCLLVQGERVRALVWEDPTCRGAARPVSHNCWACASGACAPQQERPRWWEARAPWWRVAPACHSWREPSHRNEDPTQPKKKKKIQLCTYKCVISLTWFDCI